MIKNIIYELTKNRRRKKLIRKTLIIFVCLSVLLLFISSRINLLNFEIAKYKPAEETTINKDFIGKVYFNDKPNTGIFTDLLTKSIEEASETIDIIIYSFNNEKLKNTLEEAQAKGIKINIITDKTKEKQHSELFGSNTKINIKHIGGNNLDSGDYMHHKFAIFDKNTDKEKILVGSFNYTVLQEKHDPSFILETNDKELIDSFIGEYKLISNNIRSHKKLTENSYNPFNKKINYKNGYIEIWFSPGYKTNSAKQKMLDLIDSAEKKIDIMIWRITDEDITEALFKKAQEGVKIRILSDDYYFWSKDSALRHLFQKSVKYKNKNIEIITDFYRTLDLKNKIQTDKEYFNPYIHQHTMIIDDEKLLTGTNNWTYNGFFKNDESIIVTNIRTLLDSFSESFNYHYNELRKETVKIEKNNKNVTFETPKEYYLGKKFTIYNEISETNQIPDICLDKTITKLELGIEIPEQCYKENSIFFILDNQKNVLGSGYLQL